MQLKAEHLYKTIRRRTVLEDINLDLRSGTVYGITGRNGSGKTMLFRALSGLIRPDSGQITLDGSVLYRNGQTMPNIGIVIENVALLPDLTGLQNLKYLAAVRNTIGMEEMRNAMIRVGLHPDDRRTYRKYSLGMKQRLGIAQAVMEKPDILLLDEPTNSLDEDGVRLIHQVILEERDRGALILVASHIAEDIRLLSDELFVMESGRIRGGQG